MLDLDYSIIKDGEEIFNASNVNITFMNHSPVSSAHPAIAIYGISDLEVLNNYDGFFSLTVDPLVEKGQNELEALYKILVQCEKNKERISIKIRRSNFIPEQDLPVTDYTTILNDAELGQVTKIIRTEKNDKIASMIFMLYNN
jgi:hypothetical protein